MQSWHGCDIAIPGSTNSMNEHGTDSVMPLEKWKDTEFVTVELCSSRPSGLTDEERNEVVSLMHHYFVNSRGKT